MLNNTEMYIESNNQTPNLSDVQNELASQQQDIVTQQVENFGDDDVSSKFQDLIINDVLNSLDIDNQLRGKTMNDLLWEITTAQNNESTKVQQAKQEALLVLLTKYNIPKDQCFEDLPAKKKVQCLALYHAFMSKPPIFSSWGIWERLRQRWKATTRESRYQFWLIYCLDKIHEKFKDNQDDWINSYLTQLAKNDPSISEGDRDAYIQELEALKNYLDSLKPQEGNVYWYVFAIIIGIWIGIFAKHKYDQFMTPSIQRWLPIGEITLMEPEVLALITTAKQPFRQTWERTDKQFDSSGDTWIEKRMKDAANVFQSRTITMNMEGNVEVSFDFQNYKMSFDWKRITVKLWSPTYRVADDKTYILWRNSERVEVDALNQTEQELTGELREKAIEEAKRWKDVEELAKKQIATVLFNLYHIVDPRLEWVDVILESDNIQPTLD